MYDQTIAAQDALRVGAQRQLAVMWEITRKFDGGKLYLTAHDRDLTFAGHLWKTGVVGGLGETRQQAGLTTTAVDCAGIIDGSTITLPAIRSGIYLGATVRQFKIDWRKPLLTYDEEVWFISSMVDDQLGTYICRLESRISRMQQNAGGRFAGMALPDCIYKYGGVYCKKDITAETYTGVTVATVDANRPRILFTASPGTWPAGSPAHDDDTYKGGSVVWSTGPNVGTFQEIASYIHSSRTVELFLKAPFAIQVGDTFQVLPGCSGTEAACNKRGNFVNFGGVKNLFLARDILNPDAGGNG